MFRIITYLFLLFAYSTSAQQSWCGAKQYADPDKYSIYQNFLQGAKEIESNTPIHKRDIRYFQVVIHVVARDGYQPVSQAQALQQLDVLNNDFAAMGDNINKLQDEFKPLVANAEMHFCLATLDPAGNPTSGITFTQTEKENIGTSYSFESEGRREIQYDELGGKSGWDASRYINVWVGECLDILGSASMPGEADFEEEIGIVIDIRHFGTIGDAGQYNPYGRGHTLTHEMGHFFGLKHIWGQGLGEDCNDSDDIDDTPNAGGPHYGCPEGEQLSCSTSNMYQNFMDLTDDQCLAAFTHDQVARMNSSIDLFYPDLDGESSCQNNLSDFNYWFDQLTWSTDVTSDKIIVFRPEGLIGKKDIRVFSMDGKLVFKNDWNEELTSLINLQNVASGIYLVNITMGDECKSRKVVVY
jgi:hypothetical protein